MMNGVLDRSPDTCIFGINVYKIDLLFKQTLACDQLLVLFIASFNAKHYDVFHSHLITYRSGNTATQKDFVLFQKSLRKLVMDVKVIPGEFVALQHQLLLCDMMIDIPPQI